MCHIVYIGLKGDKIDDLQPQFAAFDQSYFIASGKFRRYHGESFLVRLLDVKTFLLNVRDVLKVMVGLGSAYKILRQLKPDLLFSKGGFTVVPVGLAAKLLGIPVVTHDSDATAGLANRLIGRSAKLHITGMPEHFYTYPKEKTKYLGIPLDERIQPVTTAMQKQFKRAIGVDEDFLVLLVGGAGHGTREINQKILAIAPQLLEAIPNLHIIHIAGKTHQAAVKQKYDTLLSELSESELVKVTVLGFTPNFYQYVGAADLTITRAGATTLAELALAGKAAIVIPAPFLAGGHQLKNAEELTTRGAAEVLPNDVDAQILFKVAVDLLKNRQRRLDLAHKISSLARPQAANKISEILLKLAARK